MKYLKMMFVLLFIVSCGERDEKKDDIDPGLQMEGKWFAYELTCNRVLYFLQDQFFQETVECKDSRQNHNSKGLWTRTADEVIIMEYLDSSNPYLIGVQMHAVFKLASDRLVVTNLDKTTIMKRCGDANMCSPPQYPTTQYPPRPRPEPKPWPRPKPPHPGPGQHPPQYPIPMPKPCYGSASECGKS